MVRPTAEQFRQFSESINDDDLSEMFHKTSHGEVIYREITNTPVHNWLKKQDKYKAALESIRRRNIYKGSDHKLLLEIKLALSAAKSYSLYINRIQNPDLIPAIDKKDVTRAHTAAIKLFDCIDKGVGLQNHLETIYLGELLSKLVHEIEENAPQHHPMSKKPLLPEKLLVDNLFLLTNTAIGDHMPAVVEKLASVVANIDHTQFNRYAKSYTEKIEKRLKFICPNVHFEP